MATKKKTRAGPVERSLSRAAPPPPASSSAKTPEVRDRSAEIAALTAELERPVCSPEMEQLLRGLPEDTLSEGEVLVLALAAIKFGIEKDAWISRSLEASTRKQAAIEGFLEQGVGESSAVARAILDEITLWDNHWSDYSPQKIRVLIGHLNRLFETEPSRLAVILDQIAAREPDVAPLRATIDAVLARSSPESVAKRERWYGESENAVSSSQNSPVTTLLNELFGSDKVSPIADIESPPRMEGETATGSHVEVKQGQGSSVPSLDDKIKELAALPPEDFDGRAAAASALSSATRRVLAAELAPALNARIRTIPHDDLEGKKKVSDFVNSELGPLGLAARCPNTGLPAKLKATSGSLIGVGRFYFEVYDEGKQKKSAYSDTLPNLILMNATPEIESETHWQDHVGSKTERLGHKIS